MPIANSDRPDVQYRVTVRDMPSDERPRERLLKYGAVTLQTAELLAIILRVGTQGENVIELAARLLREHGGLGGLLTVDAALLSAERGMGEAKTSQLKAALELGRRLSALTPGGRSLANTVRSLGSPSYPAVASRSAWRKRRGVSRVPGVARSMPRAVKISPTYLS